MFAKVRTYASAISQNWIATQRVYKTLGLEVGGLFLAGLVVVAVPVALFVNVFTAVLLGVPVGLLAATYWFSRRAMRAAYSQIEGQPGAAAAVVQSLRGDWVVTPALTVNRHQDMISRVVGKPGVILISEGPSARVQPMLAAERKKTARWVPEIPIFEIQVGNDDGQVSLTKLQSQLNKLPRSLRGGEITDLRRRLDAVSHTGSGLPIPKGPMPTSARQVRRPR